MGAFRIRTEFGSNVGGASESGSSYVGALRIRIEFGRNVGALSLWRVFGSLYHFRNIAANRFGVF